MITNLLFLISFVNLCTGARILAINASPLYSHQLPLKNIIKALVAKGHEVTFATAFPIKDDLKNFSEIDISVRDRKPILQYIYAKPNAATVNGFLSELTMEFMNLCESQLELPQVQRLIKSNDTYDLILSESIGYQCLNPLYEKWSSAPKVGILSMGMHAFNYMHKGIPNNPAYNPDIWKGSTDHMTFRERVENTIMFSSAIVSWLTVFAPMMVKKWKKHFEDIQQDIDESEGSYSLVISQSHWSTNYPLPNLPMVTSTRGLHIQEKLVPLPQEVKRFLDESENGTVYFSLGSSTSLSGLPFDKVKAISAALEALPQRVLVRWDSGPPPFQSDKVLAVKWLPQQSVLAHPNVKLFVTQAGQQSMEEALYYSVPMVTIPLKFDQFHISAKVAAAGIGVVMNLRYLDQEKFEHALKTVLTDESYRENMDRMSAVFRDEARSSLEDAVWWVEYVLRHKGAPHLRCSGQDLRWPTTLLLDVLMLALVTLGLAVVVIRLLLRKIITIKTQCWHWCYY